MFLFTLFIDKELLQQKREVIQAVPSFWKAHWREEGATIFRWCWLTTLACPDASAITEGTHLLFQRHYCSPGFREHYRFPGEKRDLEDEIPWMTEVEEEEHRKVFGNLSKETGFLGVLFIHTLSACLPLHWSLYFTGDNIIGLKGPQEMCDQV